MAEPVRTLPGGRVLEPHILLYLDGVTVSFDGFKALDSLSLVLEEGELRTVIGPNGAGKTTMMDVITGKTRPDAGTVLFQGGVDLLGLDETAIARLGIGRKFQKPTVFDRLTVEENLELATQGGWGVRRLLAGRLEPEAAERIERTLATVGLAELRHEEAGRLAHGQRQWLEIGMLLVQEPRLILLDEPVAGMSDAETAKTAELILRLKGRHTIVVVEHDMHFVRELGAKVTVLHEGRVLAEGPVEAVQSDPAVVEVYLGRS
ncbi:MAG: urea ABC transporter ATP-binding protein UrtD [Geminicoccaceae bacterium]|nr:urea ABC transporter ATP-binding protein UrtD [Geminicoccaceae bacterium]